MAKVDTKQVIEYLKEAGASEEDIPILAMTAYYESNFDTLAKNKDTDSLGLFQINASRFFTDGEPDETLKSFAGDITLKQFEENLEDAQYNTNFAVYYLNVIKKDLEDGESQFGMVKDAGNDPFAIWEAYTDYVKPFVTSMKLPGRGETDEEKMQDITRGIGIYTDAMLDVNKVVRGVPTPPPTDVLPESQSYDVRPESQSFKERPIPAEGKLGMERREEGYSQREVAMFNRAVDKISAMVNKVEGSANPETKRQIQIILGQELGFDIEELPQPRRSDYDDVDRTIIDFVAELGRQKARLGG